MLQRLKNWRNPGGETRLHLARLAARYGFSIGAYTYGRPRIRFPAPGRRLSIGRYCSIADGVDIFLGGNHRTDWISTYPFSDLPGLWPEARDAESNHVSAGNVTIGNDVWIGSGATILSGVTIGDGAIIGARSVVTRDVPPYGIAAGNPARLVRLRFQADEIAALMELRWWERSRDEVATLIPVLQSGRIQDLITALTERPDRVR